MTMVTPPSGRLHALDGLRGAAALVVVIHHGLLVLTPFNAVVNGAPTPLWLVWIVNTPLHLLWAGGEAVLVFFVLSGLVLTRASIASRSFTWRAYYPTRLIRLYLPVFGAVMLACILAVVVSRSGLSGGPWLVAHRSALKFGNVVRAVTLVRPGVALDSPLWSLRWELVFSLAMPAYIWIARRVPAVLLVPLSLAISGVGASLIARGSSSVEAVALSQALCYLPVFLIGVVLALNLDTVRSWLGQRIRVVSPILLISGLVLLTLPWSLGSALYARHSAPLLVAVVVGGAAWVLLAVIPNPVQHWLESRPLQWLGKTSFSVYLTHEPVIISTAVLLPVTLRGWTLPIALPLALLVGYGFFRLVEGPSHRLAQRVNAALRQPASAAKPVGTNQ